MTTALIQASPLASLIYDKKHEQQKDKWISYAYALLTIAGADGEVSDKEMEWMLNEFMEELKATDEQKQLVIGFDYKNADLNKLLADIKIDLPVNFKRALVYDAVQMARADQDYAPEEKEAVIRLAESLGVPFYLARTIEGLVNTEKSLELTRKSIFEVEESSYVTVGNERPLQPEFRMASVIDRHILGMHYTSDKTQRNYGYALMMVAGADREISIQEKKWFKDEFAILSDMPTHIIEDVLSFDYKEGNLYNIIDEMEVDISINFSRTLLYNAIKMARADMNYPQTERDAANHAARVLGIPEDIARTIEYLVDTEQKIASMRKTLFEM
ncbi:TerB family tellurite resistance protein [Limibacter armeniacum]|uniref:TerB family tellurite resistance protein n=1 Tax=Limibacter armeniacum TaxID=466084 RepID=UPI002FE6A3A6